MFLSVAGLRSKICTRGCSQPPPFSENSSTAGHYYKPSGFICLPLSLFLAEEEPKRSKGRAQPRTLDMPPTCLNGLNTSDAARVFVRLWVATSTSRPHPQQHSHLAQPIGRVQDQRRAFGTTAPSRLLFQRLEYCLQAAREPERG